MKVSQANFGLNGNSMSNSKVTITDIAEKAGVSVATVSRVINDSKGVNPDLKSRVEQVMVEMEYVPRKKNDSREISPLTRIGFLVNDFSDEVYSHLIKGILEATGSLNIELIIYETQRSKDREINCLNQLQKSNVNGIISVANLASLNSEYKKLLSERFPIVFLVNPNDPKTPMRDDLNIVTSDSEGPFYATKYLIDLGHRDILFLGDPQTPRFKGYKKAYESTGNSLDPALIVSCEDTFVDAHDYIVEHFKNMKFTAILAATDNIGMGCWFALTEMGVKIPDDCSMIGYNNKYAEHLSLTTIAEPLIEQGKNAVYLLNECMSNYQIKPRSIVLKEGIIIRNSCRKL
jgi:LacI family transcriptional regulator